MTFAEIFSPASALFLDFDGTMVDIALAGEKISANVMRREPSKDGARVVPFSPAAPVGESRQKSGGAQCRA